MESFLEKVEKKNPPKNKERVCVFFCKEEKGSPSIQETVESLKIIDRRNKRKSSDIGTEQYIDRNQILQRLELNDVIEELQSKAPVLETPISQEDINILVSKKKSEDESKIEEELNQDIAEQFEKSETTFEKREPTEEIEEQKVPAVKKRTLLKIKGKVGEEEKEPEEKINLKTVKIGEKIAASRIPEKKRYVVRISDYYMNNRKLFVQKISQLFKPYRDEVLKKSDAITCDSLRTLKVDFDLLTHQKIVRDYLNLFTPYRGVLLYHSLGSGKSCTSIAIAEGMKSMKKIVLMTPASLKMNFFNELKKCGDPLYRKNQFWEFVPIDGKPDQMKVLAQTLGLPTEYIKKHRGAWITDITKPSNAGQLSSSDQESLNEQIDVMIRTKYYDINYNGMNKKKLREMTQGGTINPFDHSVVIIDEAHNFVSRICNKLKDKKSISYQLYHYLMDATDVRIVLVSGTPIINYPNEIGVLFNILRGYIKTWIFNLQTTTTKKINTEYILDLFHKNGLLTTDYVEYSGNVLTVTRNPYGFINTYNGSSKGGGIRSKKTKSKKIENKRRTKKSKDSVDNEVFEIKNGILMKKPVKEIPLAYEETLEYAHEQEEDIHKGGMKGGMHEIEEYSGIRLDETGNISDEDFQQQIIRILAKEGIRVLIPELKELKKKAKEEAKEKAAALRETTSLDEDIGEKSSTVSVIPPTKYLCLPDKSDDFIDIFVDDTNGEMKNNDMFKRRILGLTSYYRSSQEQLMPSLVKTENNENYHKIVINMSDYQFNYYYKIRKEERDKDKKKKKKKNAIQEAIETTAASSYRIFSRSACNFAFPAEHPRPLPDKADFNENDLNAVTKAMRTRADDYIEDDEGIDEEAEEKSADSDQDNESIDEPTRDYMQRIEDTLEQLRYDPLHPKTEEYLTEEGLEIYSPKFLRILENIQDEENEGLHMLYSQFRTVEGIGLFQLVLEAAGFAEFKIKKVGDTWAIDILPENMEKPKYVLYTGTETKEEKEVLLNIYNSTWDFIPPEMASKLREIHENNHRGEIIKLLMITSSGAEGINLRNTRFVHIMEPYWNNVRIEQVIGRARRICSHQDLPEEMRTVKVFMYIMQFTEKQRGDEKNIEIMINDISRIDRKTSLTTDQSLLEIAQIKERLNSQILKAVKESAMDCNVYNGTNREENLVCYGFGAVKSNQFGTYPTLEMDKGERAEQNVEIKKWKARKITDEETGIQYALNDKTGDVFDLESYNGTNDTGQMILVGKLVRRESRDESGFKRVEFKIDFLK